MTTYWDKEFIKNINKNNIQIIFEVGARYGTESIALSKTFPNATIHSFECNPLVIERIEKNLKPYNKIHLHKYGLGDKEEIQPFYSFIKGNDGASSFYKRIDFNRTQKKTGDIQIHKLCNIMKELGIEKIDLLCMDVQGFELNVLKGAEHYLDNIEYIIMEQPKQIISTKYLPEGKHSKYIGAPNYKEITDFMKKNNYQEIMKLEENKLEDNVMYKKYKNLIIGDSHILCLQKYKSKNNILHQFSGSSIKGLVNVDSISGARTKILETISFNKFKNLYIMFGKVDMEWVYPYKCSFESCDIDNFIEEITNKYLKFIGDISNNFENIYIMGLHLPSLDTNDMLKCINSYSAIHDVTGKAFITNKIKQISTIDNLNIRTQQIILFNKTLKNKIIQNDNYKFIDITDELLDENTNKCKDKFICKGDHHLLRDITGNIWYKKHLCKSM